MGTGNRRRDITFAKAVRMHLRGGQYLLDAYNNQVITDGVAFSITTRTFGDNNHWLLEVDGVSENPPGNHQRLD